MTPTGAPHQAQPLHAAGVSLEEAYAAGIPAERTMLLGFSQGACLTLEFAARRARRYNGVARLSGGLIGPDGIPRDYPGSLEGTPVFLGCSDVDSHVPGRGIGGGDAPARCPGDAAPLSGNGPHVQPR